MNQFKALSATVKKFHSPNNAVSHKTSSSTIKSLWQSPILLISGFVGLAIGSMTLATSITLQNFTHIRGNDFSASVQAFTAQQKQHCQISNQSQESGTSLILELDSSEPIIVNITLQATEPGKPQPGPNDFSRIKSLVESIKIIATIFSALSFTAGMQISTAHLGRIGSQKANRRKR